MWGMRILVCMYILAHSARAHSRIKAVCLGSYGQSGVP